jgi:hypothetical protein
MPGIVANVFEMPCEKLILVNRVFDSAQIYEFYIIS